MFKKILIANRGEIALRVIRTCKEMGIKTVAVYSTADAESLHVKFADEAVCIGPASECRFLFENVEHLGSCGNYKCGCHTPRLWISCQKTPSSQSLCEEHAIKFIGASAEMIDRMGDKANAKSTMIAAGVPCVPGSEGVIEDFELNVKN